MAYPTILDTFAGTAAQGTSLLTSPDHSQDHRNLGSALGNVETFLGTSAANNGQFNTFTAGQTPIPINSGTLGTVISKGTFNNAVFGSQTSTGGTFNNPVIGTPNITGGTAAALTGTATTNNLAANWLNASNGTAINIGSAGAPTAGQVVMATNGSAATWQSPIGFYASGTLAPGTTASATPVAIPNVIGTISPPRAVTVQLTAKGDWYNGAASGNIDLYLVANGGTIDYTQVAPAATNNRQSYCLSGTFSIGAGSAGTIKVHGDTSAGTMTLDQSQFTAVYG